MNHTLGPTAADRPPSSATGRADEDDDEVADKMGEEEDEELRWKDSGDLASAAKTPKAIARARSPESDHRVFLVIL